MYGWRAKIGFMLPSSCLVYEQEFWRITHSLDGVIGIPARMLITRCDADGLARMNAQIDLAAEHLATCDPDLVVYACTSGSFVDAGTGEQAIRDRLEKRTGKPVITTSQAVLAAMRKLHLKRIVMLTPYNEDLTLREIDWLAGNGLEVIDHHFCDIPENLDRAAQLPERSFELACRLNWRKADGIFLSCTNVPYLQIVEKLEQYTGCHMMTSGLATTWMALRMLGIDDELNGSGRLFKEML